MCCESCAAQFLWRTQVWCKLRGVIHVAQAARCRLQAIWCDICGASCVVKTTQCKLRGARYIAQCVPTRA
eukprot:1728847-Pyramimonas_sp.AAC.1